jgi:hypothetical protein
MQRFLDAQEMEFPENDAPIIRILPGMTVYATILRKQVAVNIMFGLRLASLGTSPIDRHGFKWMVTDASLLAEGCCTDIPRILLTAVPVSHSSFAASEPRDS